MKTPKDYVPKYSLSIKYLRRIMTKKEFDALMVKYVAAKDWKAK